MNRQKKNIINGFLVIVLSVGMSLTTNANTIEDAQKKADQLEKEKKETEKEKKSLSEELNKIISEMNDTQEKLNKKRGEIQKAEDALVSAKIEENNQYESMKKRIKFMYENGDSQFLEILVSSKSIGDFLNKADYVSRISRYDRNMLVEFQDTVKQVQEKEEALQKEYKELEGLQDQLIAKQNEVQVVLNKKNVQLADLEKQIGDNASSLKKLLEEAEEQRKKQQQANQQAQGNGGGFRPPNSGPIVGGTGQLTNPCPAGVLSSPFGYRDFDAAFHNGIDLAAPEGTPTYAASAGTVVISGWSPSAGNWVVINHGNGLTSKYMHHSANAVSAGQVVKKGQQIGYVGNTGNSFGAHLHFQVEVGGVPVDPQGYL